MAFLNLFDVSADIYVLFLMRRMVRTTDCRVFWDDNVSISLRLQDADFSGRHLCPLVAAFYGEYLVQMLER